MKKLESKKKEIVYVDDFGLPVDPKTGLFQTDKAELKIIDTEKVKGYEFKSPWFCVQKIKKWKDDEDKVLEEGQDE